MEDVQASMTTTPFPPLQTAPHESPRYRERVALREQTRVRRENDRLWRLQDVRHSPGLGNTEKTGKGSTTTMPVPALLDASGFPKRSVLAVELTALKKRMVGYREEERCRKLQEEQDLRDALANTECDAEMTGEGSTQTVQDSTEAGAPPVAVMVPPLQASDSGQQLVLSDDNLTELEVVLANPNLHPEDRQYA